MADVKDSSKLDMSPVAQPRRSRLAVVAFILAVAPPVLAFLSMALDWQIRGAWGLVNPVTSLFLQLMTPCVPTSLLLGVLAIVQVHRNPRLVGTGLAVTAVLASCGVIAAIVWFFSQMGSHY